MATAAGAGGGVVELGGLSGRLLARCLCISQLLWLVLVNWAVVPREGTTAAPLSGGDAFLASVAPEPVLKLVEVEAGGGDWVRAPWATEGGINLVCRKWCGGAGPWCVLVGGWFSWVVGALC